MVRSFRRGALAAVLALSLAPLAAACAAGNGAATLQVKPDSASTTVGVVKVLNAFVLTQTGGPATVSARVFNNGSVAQTLQSIQLAGGVGATLVGIKGGQTEITVPPQGSVLLGGKGNPAAVISTGQESLRNGDVQNAVFTFSGAGPVSVQASVTPAAGFFEPFGPSSTPTTAAPSPTTPTTTPTNTTTPKGSSAPKPKGSATPKTGVTPTPGKTH